MYKNSVNLEKFKFDVGCLKYETAKDIEVYKNVKLIRWFLSGYMQYVFEIAKSKNRVPNSFEAFFLICEYFSISKGFVYLLAITIAKITRKGFKIMKYART